MDTGSTSDNTAASLMSVFLALGSFSAVAVLVGRLGLGYACVLSVAVFSGNYLLGLLVSRRCTAMEETYFHAQLEAKAAQQKSHADYMSCMSRLSKNMIDMRLLLCNIRSATGDGMKGGRE
jgi:xanthine/uracil/vitamin C permease (AzgA family)